MLFDIAILILISTIFNIGTKLMGRYSICRRVSQKTSLCSFCFISFVSVFRWKVNKSHSWIWGSNTGDNDEALTIFCHVMSCSPVVWGTDVSEKRTTSVLRICCASPDSR
jgi:hypothetical protein